MRQPILSALAAFALLAANGGALGHPLKSECLIRLSKIANAPRFKSYPAKAVGVGRPAPPLMGSGEAHRYRTLLRQSGGEPPNFAGHFRIVIIGCGSSCMDFAIVDAASGRVFFEPELRAIAWNHVVDDHALRFRRESRLLVVEGAPREDIRREGVEFAEWTGTRFRTIRRVPRRLSCSTEPANG